jgi:APA family basic amino acid/polyamine antiporter
MKAPDAPRQFKVPGYPFVPAVFILFCVGLVGNSILERPYESGVGLALMATGIPFYFYWNRLMGKKAESQVSDGIKKE